MTCSNCGTDNPPGQKFCGECGVKLAAGCPACGATNPPGQKFCGECGSALGGTAAATPSGAMPSTGGPDLRGAPGGTAAAQALEAPAVAERRLVSVLFADLVGFTPFAEERDSEEVRETLTRYFDMARDVIEQYGGTVEKFIGDAVMAVWGTPTAREDDAERAVRAGLELVTAIRGLGPTIQVRAGVFTGEAAVTLGATNQGMVAGDVVNTAARIQSVAPPGACLVGESTFRAASAAIAFEDAGEPTLKGKSAPVPVWRAMRIVAERGGRGRSDTLEAPFVGRDDQLRLLKELYHTTIRERRTRLISVTGMGGVGKSRLAWEFEKYLDGLVERVLWHHGRSPAYGQGVTFWALGEMVRYRCGLVETDGEHETRSKVAETVAGYTQDPAERRWVESSLLALLGVEGPGESSEELFAGWRTFFERLAGTAPVVMVFEDLHWADPGTLDFIDHLLDWAKNIPLAIITLARPELLEHRPDWGAGRRNFVGLALEPLPEPAMRELLAGLVPGLPEPTVRAIVERAGGIPLYAVETVRTLVADHRLELRDGVYQPVGDLTTLAIPDTLTALIAARLDALDPADRALLLDAAVLGQSFTTAGLAAISGQSVEELEPRLRALVRKEILSGTGDMRSPERGQFIFVQALIREVAYNTLTHRDRKERHLAAARYFESLESGEIAGALAGQYLAAHQNAAEGPEADALAAQARIALSAAAERAASLGAHSQAVTFLEQAMSVTTDPGERADLLERAGTAASVTADNDAAVRYLEEARELRAQAGDRRLLARVTASLGRTLLTAKHRNQAQTMLETAAATFTDLEGSPELATIHSQLARAYYLGEDHRRAVEVADRVLETAEHQNLIPLLADTLVTKGSALGMLGRVREASAVVEAGGRLAEAAGLTFTALRALNNRLIWEGEATPREALAACWDGLALARRVGQRGWALGFAGNGGFQAFRIGEWEAARRELEAALEDAGDAFDQSLLLNNLSNLLAALGEPYEETFARLEASAAGLDPDHAAGMLEETRGWVALAHDDLGEAQRCWGRAAAAQGAAATGVLFMSAHAALWAGELEQVRAALAAIDASGIHGAAIDAQRTAIRAGIAGLEGRRGDAVAGYREATAAWQTLDLPWDAALMAFDMAAVLEPSEPDVKAALDAAEATLRALGAKPFLERLERVRAGKTGPASATRSAPAQKAAEVETPT